ncbi:reverse transcriptase domain-containing protein [Tanacetum coccineum]
MGNNLSYTMNEAERKYTPMEKLALSLLHMSRRILNKTEASRNLAKYAVELGAYNITYEPRNAIKGQVLADFLPETPMCESMESFFRTPPEKDDTDVWTLFTDDAFSLKGSGAGLVLIRPSGVEYTYALSLNFISSNNEAEYEALLAGLRITRKTKVQSLESKVDSTDEYSRCSPISQWSGREGKKEFDGKNKD